MKYYKKISGEKVYLSPVSVDDAELFTQWLNDEEITVNLALLPRVFSLAKEKEYVENTLSKSDNDFCIVDQQTDQVIGVCGLMNVNPTNRTAEIGIMIGDKNYWSKGYGTNAIKLLLDFGFKVRNLNNIMLQVHGYNKRAIRCYEKAGFKKIGARREAIIHGELKSDLIYMDILASEHHSDYLNRLIQP